MPVNGYTVGRDVQINMAGPDGVTVVLPPDQITHFDAKPLKKEEWARPLNRPPIPLYMPDGWRITIENDRMDSSLDTFMSDLEQAFWGGQNMLAGTILQTVTEKDGSVSQWLFEGVQFWVEDPGSYRADGKVNQRVDACASIRRKL